MAKTKKLAIEVSRDIELVKRMEEVSAKLCSKNIKAIIFNHKNLVYDTRGLAVYNPNTRHVVTLGSVRSTDFSVAPDTIVNVSRLEALEDVAKEEDLLKHPNVYAIVDKDNNFKCVDSKYDKKLDFDKDSEDCLTVYYNEYFEANNYPKYLVREKEGQYKLCYDCHKLLLDDLDHAEVGGDEFCYDCIVKRGRENAVDPKKLKLMQLHKLDAE